MTVLGSPTKVRLRLNLWSPFLFLAFGLSDIAEGWSKVNVVHGVGRFDRNANGSAFGGALFVMVDTFFPLMMMHHLGRGYRVWSRAATVDFVAPGRGNGGLRCLLNRLRWSAFECRLMLTNSRARGIARKFVRLAEGWP
ncbi:DUF4442 domain-containing protein [Saccharopolyspora sp. ASAGF58]|uniref:DUF4442 domain-containing protein n=1 Tax=Saccharopolyspora sp. ASAGF58 TaxID=2719023 RepID=UPI00143FF703|nr:DUF4442 domain-containing protein [Saccharopolyspora sp. ASAGF58]